MINGMKLIKATSRENTAKEQLASHLNRIESLSFRNGFDVQIVRGVFEYASAAAFTILLFGAPWFLGVDVVSVLIVIAIFVRLFPKVTALRQCVQSVGQVLPAYATLHTMVEKASAAREVSAEAQAPEFCGLVNLRLQQTSVRGELGELILDQVTTDIPAGAFVAIVGPTGPARRHSSTACLASSRRHPGRCWSIACRCVPLDCTHGAARSAISARIRSCSVVRSARTYCGTAPAWSTPRCSRPWMLPTPRLCSAAAGT